MTPSDAFFAGSRYAIFGARSRGRAHGPVLIAALGNAGKRAVAIEADGAVVKGSETARTLETAGPVDGAVLLPPTPWNEEAAAFTADAVRQCKASGIERVWIYTAGDPASAVEIASQQGIDACAGRCPCLHIEGGGFPHGTHRLLMKLLHQLPGASA
jgi:hypothetical protein